MSALTQPTYNTIKKNIVTILAAVSSAEVTAGNPGFTVERDRWRNWEDQDATGAEMTARVNVLMESMTPNGGGSHIHTDYTCVFNVDMYVLGAFTTQIDDDGESVLTPANIEAADRLDLLISQVLFGLTQLKEHDFGIAAGLIGRQSKGIRLTINNQGENQTVGTFAPARFVMELTIPYEASDNGATFNMTTLTATMEKTLEDIQTAYTYTHI